MAEIFADRKVIDKYYEARSLITPTATEALLFLITEVAELAQAYDAQVSAWELSGDPQEQLTMKEALALQNLYTTRARLEDQLARRRKDWVRNHENQSVPDLLGEIGDVYMMLDRFSQALKLPEVGVLLGKKMEKKGFTLDEKAE